VGALGVIAAGSARRDVPAVAATVSSSSATSSCGWPALSMSRSMWCAAATGVGPSDGHRDTGAPTLPSSVAGTRISDPAGSDGSSRPREPDLHPVDDRPRSVSTAGGNAAAGTGPCELCTQYRAVRGVFRRLRREHRRAAWRLSRSARRVSQPAPAYSATATTRHVPAPSLNLRQRKEAAMSSLENLDVPDQQDTVQASARIGSDGDVR
jgi:hypothetical protein